MTAEALPSETTLWLKLTATNSVICWDSVTQIFGSITDMWKQVADLASRLRAESAQGKVFKGFIVPPPPSGGVNIHGPVSYNVFRDVLREGIEKSDKHAGELLRQNAKGNSRIEFEYSGWK